MSKMYSSSYKKLPGLERRRLFAASRANARRAGSVAILRNPVQIARLSSRGKEIKALDIAATNYTLNTTAVVTPLNLIRAGASFFNRVGRKIEMKSIHIKGFINPLRTNAAPDYVRVIVVYDRQTNGAAPAIADILQDTDQAGTNSTDCFSSVNLNNRDRFAVLMDARVVLPSLTVTAGVVTNPGFIDPIAPTFDLERYIKLKGLVTLFKADSSPAVIGDVSTGGLYLVTFGKTAPGAEGFQFGVSMRLRYNDN